MGAETGKAESAINAEKRGLNGAIGAKRGAAGSINSEKGG